MSQSSNSGSHPPATIPELADRALGDPFDDRAPLKQHLRTAEKYRKEGKELAKQGDLENAFVLLAKAATLVLEKLPAHREYQAVLSAEQQNNLALNGQDILDNLGELKKVLVQRYEDWQKRYPNGVPPPSNGNAHRPVDDRPSRAYGNPGPAPVRVQNPAALRDQDRRAADEARQWKIQREQAEMRDLEQRMRDAELAEARVAEQRRGEQEAMMKRQQVADEQARAIRLNMKATTPGQGPYITPTHSPHHSQPPYSLANGLSPIPLEPPRRYENASNDSSVILTPRAPVYPSPNAMPITTTSPPPGALRIGYPNLMSPHQQRQGYRPSIYGGPSDSLYDNPLPLPSAPVQQSRPWDNRPPSPPHERRHSQSGWYPALPAPSIKHPVPASAIQYPSYPGPTRAPPPVPAPQTAPASAPIKSTEQVPVGLKQVTLPRECLPRFIAIAKANTNNNKETCGLLLGKDKGHKYVVTTLLIPRQHATSDTCTMDEEELVLQFTEERNLITLGWIHTHPSQSCFMSSVDLHTHSGFQRMLPESFAVVCAPNSTPNFGIFRLTDPPGLKIILGCTEKDAFHPHPDLPIYTDADKGHVHMKSGSLEIVDLR